MSWAANLFVSQRPDSKDLQHNMQRILLVTSRSWGLMAGQNEVIQLLPRTGAHQVSLSRSSACLVRRNSTAPLAVLGLA